MYDKQRLNESVQAQQRLTLGQNIDGGGPCYLSIWHSKLLRFSDKHVAPSNKCAYSPEGWPFDENGDITLSSYFPTFN